MHLKKDFQVILLHTKMCEPLPQGGSDRYLPSSICSLKGGGGVALVLKLWAVTGEERGGGDLSNWAISGPS